MQFRRVVIPVLAVSALALVPSGALAQRPARTLVLPPRTLGVSDTTSSVFAAILAGELERRGVPVVPEGALPADLARGSSACGDSACATALAVSLEAERVVFGSLGRLGDKVIVRVRAITLDHPEASYADQLTSTTEDDLDAVAARIAETLASGHADASRATIGTITAAETLTPRRRASRGGAGLRAGFLFPTPGSYGGDDPLTGFRMVFRYEVDGIFAETTPMLGFTWGDHSFEWTMLDIHVGRTFGRGDWGPFVGAGLGMHTLRLERAGTRTLLGPGGVLYPYATYDSESETALVAQAGVGLVMLRTWDLSLIVDLRVHKAFANFERLGGDDATGVTLSFGTTRLGEPTARPRRSDRSITDTWR